MTRTISLLLSLIICINVTAQQSTATNAHTITFQLKIPNATATDTMAIIWFTLPYQPGAEKWAAFPATTNSNGLYQQSIAFPDSLSGKTIGYLYARGQNYDILRSLVLEQNVTNNLIDNWGFADGLAGKVQATKMLFYAPGSPDEKAAFAAPYVGITTDGTTIKNLYPIKKTGYSTLAIKNAITAFTNTLTKEEKAIAMFPIESDEWRRWHNIEQWERAGICLEKMTAEQKKLVFNILKESLSAKGLQKAKNIMSMENYLASLVPEVKELGGEKYWFTFFGTPSDKEPYGWQIEGHHLVINYFILGDQVVMTPTFMGSEPTLIEKGDHKGVQTFEAEERKGLKFYLSLDSNQQKTATLWNKKDYDFNRGEAFRDNEIIAKTGIAATSLSATQQAALLDLIAEYVNNIRDGQAKVKMEDVKLHLKETNFTWVQSGDIMSPFYYRIHSPVILIEFDHQTPVFLYDKNHPDRKPVKTHIHTVVRTPNGNDYGKDLLEEHLKKQHKQN